MIATVVIFQIAFPVAVLVWLSVWPAPSLAGLALQAAGAAAFLFALALVAQWALPVWWMPWVYGAFWLAAVVFAIFVSSGLAGLALWPSDRSGWSSAALSAGLIVLGGWFAT